MRVTSYGTASAAAAAFAHSAAVRSMSSAVRAATTTSAPASASADRGSRADALARAGDDRDPIGDLEAIEDHCVARPMGQLTPVPPSPQ